MKTELMTISWCGAQCLEAFRQARKEVEATLVLLGNFATDDPEGAAIYETLVGCREERILVLPYGDDSALVNTLQTRAAAVNRSGASPVYRAVLCKFLWPR
jgi:trehalose synthase